MSGHNSSCHWSTCLNWDHFVFSQQWAISSVTNFHNRRVSLSDKSKWTIHGLWPGLGPHNTNTDKCLCRIDEEEYNLDLENEFRQNGDLLERMEKTWPTFNPKHDNNFFWNHEWKTHGLVAATHDDLNTHIKYFSKALELHDTYNMLSILHAAGIDPSDTQTYTLDELEQKIRAATGHDVFITFTQLDKHVEYILEIRLYLDKKYNVIDCMESKESDNYSPKKAVIYPETLP